MIDVLLSAIKGTDLSGFSEKIKIALPLISAFKETIPLEAGEIEVAINLRFKDDDIIIYVIVLGVKEFEGKKEVVITRTYGTYKVSEYMNLK